MSNKANIEEDIKTLEDYRKELGLSADGNKIKVGFAIENILADRERLEKENEGLKIDNFNSLSEECSKLAKETNWTKEDTNRVITEYREMEAKANKYDSLVEKIKDKDKEVEYRLNETMITERDMQFNLGKRTILQELLDTEKQQERGGKMKQILDVCCGSKMFWFNKKNPNTIFMDNRELEDTLCDGRRLEVKPDIVADFRNIPFEDNSFYLVVFDPPHLKQIGENSYMAKKYGKLNDNWPIDIKQGFIECMRVLKPNGTLIFKWNEQQIKLKEILDIIDYDPLFRE